MKPVEMPEFKHPSVRLESNDWGCLHCWKNNAAPYIGVTWALVKHHLEEKCVTSVPSHRLLGPRILTSWMCRHEINEPTENDYYCAKSTLQSDFFIREATAM